MNFALLLEELLTELSGEEIYKKYYSKIPYDNFIDLISADPQTVVDVDSGKIQRMGKYSKLLVALYQKGGLQLEDLEKAKEYLGYVYQHRIAIDLGKIKELGDLYNVVKDYIAKDTKSLDEILKILSKDEFKVLHNGEKWYIFQPLTEKASCYLGVNTEWCTTWGPYSLNKKHKDRGNMFSRYSPQGPLFIMIDKEDFDHKYQFHFESNQFMDRDDRKINVSKFITRPENKEVFNYFFPSFTREVGGNEIQMELKRMDILPDELGLQLFEKSVGKVNNRLVNAVLNDNVEDVSELLGGINVDIDGGRIEIGVDNLHGDLEQLNQNISFYEYEANSGWEFVYDDMRDRGIDEYEEEKLKTFLQSYYNENTDEFLQKFSIKTFNEFITNFFDTFKDNDKIQDAFWSDIADLSYESYENGNTQMVDEIKKDISISSSYSGYEVSLSIVKFSQFLLKKGYENATDEDVLNEMLDDYVSYCNHDGEFERLYNFQITYPKYNEGNQLTKETDKFFDYILEDVERSGSCMKLRKTFNQIIQKYFNNYSKVYENKHIRVKLKSTEINCDTGMVKIEYTNKDTGEKFGGWNEPDGVKVENLASLLTNYKLFESYSRYKKLIK
jgi:hypothetical protein